MDGLSKEPGEVEKVAGVVYGVHVEGRLPAGFRPYLLPASGERVAPAGALALSHRLVETLPEVEELWATEVPAPEPPGGPGGHGASAIASRFALFREPGGFGLSVVGESRGHFRSTASEIRSAWTSPATGAPHHFFSYALPLWLESQGVPVLHGSVVALGERAIGFLGPSGIGKSVLAVELARLGCGFVADDGLVLRRGASGEWRCFHGPPLLRLWPSALRDRLEIAADGLPRVHETIEKRQLRAPGETAAARAAGLPLAAVYLLGRRPAVSAEGAQPPVTITELGPRDALVRLLEHGVAAAPAAALGLAGRRFELLADVAEKVPLRLLEYPGSADTAARIKDALARDLEP